MELDNGKIKKIFKSLATTEKQNVKDMLLNYSCLLYTSPSPRD